MDTKTPVIKLHVIKLHVIKLPVYRCNQQDHILDRDDYIRRLNGRPVWGDLQKQQPEQPEQQVEQQVQHEQHLHQGQEQEKQQYVYQQKQQVENINPQVMDSTNLGKRNIREN